MPTSPLAGTPAHQSLLIDPYKLEADYFNKRPNLDDPNQLVSFGTSGHRGTPFDGTFTEAHILAIAQAICDYRRGQGTDGPLYMGKDTHALSAPAQRTALEVLAANGISYLSTGGVFNTYDFEVATQMAIWGIEYGVGNFSSTDATIEGIYTNLIAGYAGFTSSQYGTGISGPNTASCCGGQAQIFFAPPSGGSLMPGIPEPSSWAMMRS